MGETINKGNIINRPECWYKLTDKRVERDVLLKIIGFVLMFLGELGELYNPLPIYSAMKYVSFLIFADCLIVGFQNTSNMPKYLVRLWIFGLIAQIPYTLLNETTNLNVLFTYIAGLLCMYFVNKKESYMIIYVFLAVAYIIPIAYSVYYLSVIVIMYCCRDNIYKKIFLGALFTAIVTRINYNPEYSNIYFTVGVILIEYVKSKKINIMMDNIKLYYVYPLMLTILFLLKLLILY